MAEEYLPCIYIGDWNGLTPAQQCMLYGRGYRWRDGRNVCAHEMIGGYPLPNPCTQQLIVSNVNAIHEGGDTVKVTWSQNIAGWVRVLKNGTNIQQGNYPSGNNYLELSGVSAGTYTFCVEAV